MKVLLLSPHTDDVELGAGGTVIKLLKQGHEIKWIVFSTAKKSVPKNLNSDILKDEFLRVTQLLKIRDYEIFDFPVREFSKFRQDILEELVKIRNNFKPELVIGPSLNDIHQDHQVIANEMARAFKMHSSIISYELPWNNIKFRTEFFSILKREEVDMKVKMLGCYKSQIIKKRPYFDKDFIYGLARTRGTQVNSDFAEAFEVIRWRL